MKKLTDEQIQALLDGGNPITNDGLSAPDRQQLESYQSLFSKLNAEPAEGLPFNFARKVTAQLQLKLKRQSDIRFNLLALLGVIVGLVSVYGLLSLMDLNAASAFLQAVLRFKWVWIIGVFTLIGVLVFEQQVVEEREHRFNE